MREPIWAEPDDIKVPPDFLTHQDTRCVTEAIKILKKEYGDEVAIIGKTMGPWTLGYHCIGRGIQKTVSCLLMSAAAPTQVDD